MVCVEEDFAAIGPIVWILVLCSNKKNTHRAVYCISLTHKTKDIGKNNTVLVRRENIEAVWFATHFVSIRLKMPARNTQWLELIIYLYSLRRALQANIKLFRISL